MRSPMERRRRRLKAAGLATAGALLALSACSSSGSTGQSSGVTTTPDASQSFEAVSGDVRGFDGTTIKVASMGLKASLPGVEVGVEARIKRFNDTDEIP